MPSLPFTLEDIMSWNPGAAPNESTSKEVKPDMSMHNPQNRAQAFLKSKLGKVKDNFASKEGLLDVGLALNPVTRIVDMGSKFFGGPGIEKGFQEGVNMTGKTRIPPIMF